jgi:hypothetical protein
VVTVAVEFGVDASADACRRQLAEVVALGGHARRKDGPGDRVAGIVRNAAGRAGCVLAVIVAVGLEFGHAIGARLKVVEAVIAGGVGRGRHAGRIARGVQQRELDLGDCRLAAFAQAVVVIVLVNVSRERRGQQFAEVVTPAPLAACQRNLVDPVAGVMGHSAGRAGHVQPVVIALRLGLGHAVGPRRQLREAVVSGGVGRGRFAGRIVRGVQQ